MKGATRMKILQCDREALNALTNARYQTLTLGAARREDADPQLRVFANVRLEAEARGREAGTREALERIHRWSNDHELIGMMLLLHNIPGEG